MPLREIDQNEFPKIRDWVNQDSPLGPADSAQIDDELVSKILFDEQNKLYSKSMKNPTFIIGRRGSGKTAFLKHMADCGDYDIAINLDTSKLFRLVIRKIDYMTKEEGYIFVENISDIWNKIFYSLISREISKISRPNIGIFRKFSLLIGIDATSGTEGIISRILQTLAEKSKDQSVSIFASAAIEVFGSEDINEMRKFIFDFTKENNIKVVILIDNIEEYNESIKNLQVAIGGLIKSASSFNVSKSKPEIRFCIPTERYEFFRDSSSNLAKDFSKRLLLQWHSTELLSLLAHRILINMRINYWDDPGIRRLYGNIDFRNKKDVMRLFYTIMPQSIRNCIGIREPTITYILRHTQLLPRQIILLFQEIVTQNTSGGGHIMEISENSIISGIAKIEDTLWRDICRAYSHKYPWINEAVSKIIPNTPLEFPDSLLHSIYNEKGFKHQDIAYGIFVRALLEIGCIGIKQRDSDIYTSGIFEYSLPNVVSPPDNCKYVLHPLFCGGAKTMELSCRGIERVILPYGADIETQDMRE